MALTRHDLVRDPVLQLTFQSLLLSTCLRKQSKQSGQLATLPDGENEVFDIINVWPYTMKRVRAEIATLVRKNSEPRF